MNSYQKRKQEIEALKKEVNQLKGVLYSESKIFYSQLDWLGVGQLTTGLVVKGELVDIHRDQFNFGASTGRKIEIKIT